MKNLVLVLLSILLTPITALLSAKMYATMWDLSLAAQYGSGPSYQSWYGIALLFGLLTFHLLYRAPDPKSDAKRAASSTLFFRAIAFYVFGGVLILCLLLARAVLGWA